MNINNISIADSIQSLLYVYNKCPWFLWIVPFASALSGLNGVIGLYRVQLGDSEKMRQGFSSFALCSRLTEDCAVQAIDGGLMNVGPAGWKSPVGLV